jgi:hypothetical protein
MTKKETLKSYRVDKLDDNTVFINGRSFMFSYIKADSVVKEEYKGKYRYFGGLQCDYPETSEDYKNLENWLCEIAEKTLIH